MSDADTLKLILSAIDNNSNNGCNLSTLTDIKYFKKVLNVVRNNGLYYSFMTYIISKGVDIPNSEMKIFENELVNLGRLKNTIHLLNRTSKESGIKYTLIKACTTISHVPRDLDIYVLEKDLSYFVQALEKNGMECIHSDDVDTTLVGDNLIKVDIYTGLCYFSFEFIGSNYIVKSRVKDHFFDIEFDGLTPEAEYLIVLIHGIFGHSSYSLLDLIHMNNLLNEMSDFELCRKYAYEMGWGIAFDSIIKEINQINNDIYSYEHSLSFPHVLSLNFMWKSIFQIDNFDLTLKKKIFLFISLMQDRLVIKVRKTPLYNLLKSIAPVRKLINSIGYLIRNLRGDVRSA